MLNLVFFGFSVTRYGNPPYPERLKEILRIEGIDKFKISYAALGGVSLDCVPFIMNHLKKLKPDILVFEIATSHYSISTKEVQDTKEILLKILKSSSLFCKQIEFLLLPRKDIPEGCTIPTSLNMLSKEYSFGTIDFRAELAQDWETNFIDFVHPTQVGVEKICLALAKYFQNRTVTNLDINVIDQLPRELFLKDYISHYKYPLLNYFEHTNFSYIAIPLRMGEVFDHIVQADGYLNGIFYIMGPNTSSFEIKISSQIFPIRAFDKWSYYYRIGYTSLPKKILVHKNDLIQIISSENRFNTLLEKKSDFKVDGIVNYPISLAMS